MTYLVTTERLISLGIEQWRERVVPGARIARRVRIPLACPWRPKKWEKRQARSLSVCARGSAWSLPDDSAGVQD
jgi:hypothetical protein